ncbi:MAG: FAD:protein FMN transferase [Gammaproteobacteria bacterium]|nr:MAG: FAD:protein FMN transferase [Gammaproteobacteria bacterium]
MGTRIVVQLWHPDAEEGKRLVAAAMAEFDRIEALMSTYREDSEISRVNRYAAERPIPVSEELYDIVRQSIAMSRLTQGAFDITYESVGYLYAFRERQAPTDAQVDARLDAIDYHHLLLDPEARSIAFAMEGVRINLGGIGKGYACDRAVDLIRQAGVEHALVSAGGDTRLLGDRRGQPWVVGIRDPDDADAVVTRLALVDEAISTSGDYERYFEDDGVRYHHILDPATGRPSEGVRSVTIIGPDGTRTDALSTSVFVMGADAGLELIERLPDYEAIVIDSTRGVRVSGGLAPP